MPLTNNVIIKLNEITTMVENKSNLSESDIEEVQSIFKNLVENNERYDIDEIEFWFENEGSWKMIMHHASPVPSQPESEES